MSQVGKSPPREKSTREKSAWEKSPREKSPRELSCFPVEFEVTVFERRVELRGRIGEGQGMGREGMKGAYNKNKTVAFVFCPSSLSTKSILFLSQNKHMIWITAISLQLTFLALGSGGCNVPGHSCILKVWPLPLCNVFLFLRVRFYRYRLYFHVIYYEFDLYVIIYYVFLNM